MTEEGQLIPRLQNRAPMKISSEVSNKATLTAQHRHFEDKQPFLKDCFTE